MALAGDDDDVAALGEFERSSDGGTPIGDRDHA